MKINNKNFFWIVAGVIIFCTTLPFLVTQIVQLTTSYYHTGVDSFVGGDKAVYLSYMEQAREGSWLFKNLYTSEPQTAKFFSPVWLILGKIGYLFSLNSVIILHLSRILFSLIFLFLIYKFLGIYFPQELKRRVVFLALLFSMGFGLWQLFYMIFSQPVINNYIIHEKIGTDIWIAESNTFLSIFHSSLFVLSQIFILIIFWLFLKNINKFTLKKGLFLILLTLFLGIFHTYDLIIICSVLGVFLLFYFLINKKVSWPAIFNYLLIIISSLITVIYFLITINQEIALKGWIEQNVLYSPAFFNYISGYGLIFIFFLLGIFSIIKKRDNYFYLFILVWAQVQILLLYSPFPFQTKLSNGLHIPLSIIAGFGFFWIMEKFNNLKITVFKKYIIKIFFIQLTIFFLLSGVLFSIVFEIDVSLRKELPFYLNKNEYQAMNWLDENVRNDEVILSDGLFGAIIPAYTARTVYLGHSHQTINWDKKLTTVGWFLKTNGSDKAKKEWLKREGIDYIFYSQKDKDLGSFQPQEKDYLELVNQNEEISIFRVK